MSTAPPTTVVPTTVPTTAALTTLEPTTDAATTLTPTTFLTTAAPTTAAPISGDIVFEQNLIVNVDPLEIILSIHGFSLNTVVFVLPLEIEISIEGEFAHDTLVVVDPLNFELSIVHDGVVSTGGGGVEVPLTGTGSNWVKWSKIGYLDFTIDEMNEAGERPLDWRGPVYHIIKLGKSLIAYGQNGVTILSPSGVHWGMQTISRIGIKNKGSACGNEFEHYFIDQKERLCKLSGEGVEILDYSEYLSVMTNPRMSFDIELGLIYICDGTYGFVYSTRSKSLGTGPINITGVGTQSGTLYITAPGEIEIPKFHICTDIYDLNTRKLKTIQWIEVGTDLTHKLQMMIEARFANNDRFFQSKWALVNPSGIAHIPCYGVEFKFHLRSYIYEFIELDYLRINGVVHGSSFLDYTQTE